MTDSTGGHGSLFLKIFGEALPKILVFAVIKDESTISEAYSEPCQKTEKELFAKIFNAYSSFQKTRLADVWLSSEYVSTNKLIKYKILLLFITA